MIVIASDHAGFSLKERVRAHLEARGLSTRDLGAHSEDSCDYPDFAHALSQAILEGQARLGVLICGTGIGMSITANRHPGIRAALCHDTFSAHVTRLHNDANVLCMGSRVVGEGLAIAIVDAFLSGEFEGGRHQRRVEKIELPSA